MAYTEFCCRSGGSNLNAGTRTGNSTEPGVSASFTYASGSWVSATGVFTVASGNPSADGVAVGDFASVYADGASVTTLIGRVTAVSSTTITVSLAAKAGTTTDGTSNRTLKIGGAWQGPNGSSGFPFGFVLNTLTNATGERPRVNFKNDATYAITAAITHNVVNGDYITFRGYTSSYADGGRFKIDGGTTGASYTLLTVGGAAQWVLIEDMELCNNGATGSADGATLNAQLNRVVCHDVRGSGLVCGSNSAIWEECEAYACNQSNTASKGGFAYGGTMNAFVRCIAHDNTGSNTRGFFINGTVQSMQNCIADSNGSHGIEIAGTTATQIHVSGCDCYNNGGDGLRITTAGALHVQIANCNFVKNSAWGLNLSGGNRHGHIWNSGFGTGTQANASGTVSYPTLWMGEASGLVNYAADTLPWADAPNGDFRISLAAAKAAGRGSFLQTQSGHAGTVGYPDIGAGQSQASGGTSKPTHPMFQQVIA